MMKIVLFLFAVMLHATVVIAAHPFSDDSKKTGKETREERSIMVNDEEIVKKENDLNIAANSAASYRDEHFPIHEIVKISVSQKKDYYIFDLSFEGSNKTVQIECSAIKEDKCKKVK